MALARYVLIACAGLTASRAQYGGLGYGSSPGGSSGGNVGSMGYGASSSGSSGSSGYGSGSSGGGNMGSSYGASPAQSSYPYGGTSNQGSGSSGYGSMMSSAFGGSAPGYGNSGGGYGGSSGGYGNGGSYYTTAAPPASSTGTTTIAPGNTTCPGVAPIGCRYQALIDPVTGNVLFCLLVCDQPVTQTPTTPTTPAPVTASPATSTTTTGTTTTTTVDPTIALQAQIEACVAAGLRPDPTCTFNGFGQRTPPITCAEICPSNPDISPCDPTVGNIIDKCICSQATSLGSGCTFTFRGTLSPLTCSQLCPPFPGA